MSDQFKNFQKNFFCEILEFRKASTTFIAITHRVVRLGCEIMMEKTGTIYILLIAFLKSREVLETLRHPNCLRILTKTKSNV